MNQITPNYPLIAHAADSLSAANGKPLAEITLDEAAVGRLSAADLQISAETLRAQAEIARRAGYEQLAANLRRAAELTAVPNAGLLAMYDTLRPGRATLTELLALADTLEREYQAAENARFVREAASVYQARGLLRRE
ncbi:MAG: diol dehydratase small subunit [Anaerolineae bacterium]